MLDAYGLQQTTRAQQQYRLTVARDAYEANCARRHAAADWENLDSDRRHLWIMTADALITHGFSRQTAQVA